MKILDNELNNLKSEKEKIYLENLNILLNTITVFIFSLKAEEIIHLMEKILKFSNFGVNYV